MSWHNERESREWKIIYYIKKDDTEDEQIYDVEYYRYNRIPVQWAGYGIGLATRFEIEEVSS